MMEINRRSFESVLALIEPKPLPKQQPFALQTLSPTLAYMRTQLDKHLALTGSGSEQKADDGASDDSSPATPGSGTFLANGLTWPRVASEYVKAAAEKREVAAGFSALPLTEPRRIADSDPREALRGQFGLFAKSDIEADVVVGAYVSWLGFEHDVIGVEGLVGALQLLEFDRYSFAIGTRFAGEHAECKLICSAYGECGNATKFINDYRIEFKDEANTDAAVATGKFGVGIGPNIRAVEVMHDHWPYLFMVTNCRIPAGSELLLDYGVSYWRGLLRSQKAHNDWRTRVKSMQAATAKALA